MMQNKGLKEVAGGGLGSAVGVLFVVLAEQFGGIQWNGTNATLVVLALQGIWSFVRPYIPKPNGGENA
jgi:hypothetical protein